MCMWERRRFHIFQFVSVLILRKHYFGHWANLGSCWLRTARQFSHAYAGKADQELPLAFSLPTWHSQYMMQILAHHSRFADTVRPSKTMFLVRTASERAQEECIKFCLLERAPRHLLFFDFKLRKLFEGCALWIKSQQQSCVFRKGAAELICVRLEFKAVLFRVIYGFDSILGFYYICGQFLLHL